MEYDRINTFRQRCTIKWVKLPHREKMEWEEKGRKEGKAGFTLFVEECSKKEKKEDKLKGKELYDPALICTDCNLKTLKHLGNGTYVCDVCGEVMEV